MKLYMIRHKPSGLFYTPIAKSYSRENLSERGKVYHRKPRIPVDARSKRLNDGSNYRRLLQEDFEILVYEAKHVDTLE